MTRKSRKGAILPNTLLGLLEANFLSSQEYVIMTVLLYFENRNECRKFNPTSLIGQTQATIAKKAGFERKYANRALTKLRKKELIIQTKSGEDYFIQINWDKLDELQSTYEFFGIKKEEQPVQQVQEKETVQETPDKKEVKEEPIKLNTPVVKEEKEINLNTLKTAVPKPILEPKPVKKEEPKLNPKPVIEKDFNYIKRMENNYSYAKRKEEQMWPGTPSELQEKDRFDISDILFDMCNQPLDLKFFEYYHKRNYTPTLAMERLWAISRECIKETRKITKEA